MRTCIHIEIGRGETNQQTSAPNVWRSQGPTCRDPYVDLSCEFQLASFMLTSLYTGTGAWISPATYFLKKIVSPSECSVWEKFSLFLFPVLVRALRATMLFILPSRFLVAVGADTCNPLPGFIPTYKTVGYEQSAGCRLYPEVCQTGRDISGSPGNVSASSPPHSSRRPAR